MGEVADENVEVVETEERNIPALLDEHFRTLGLLKQQANEAKDKAKKNQEFAIKVKKDKPGIFTQKRVVTNIQDAVVGLAENQVESADINSRLLAYQQKQSETMKFLLGLGVSNIASNRAVVKYLKEKLAESGDKKLDSIEEEEILSVLKQLKAQEDILEKQAQTLTRLKKMGDELAEYRDKEDEQDKELEGLKAKVTKLEKRNKVLFALALLALGIAIGAAVVAVILLIK